MTVAATLCAEKSSEPYVVVHGSQGRITFWYRQDRVLVQRAGHGPVETEYGRTDLLENLVAHVTDGEPLRVPPAETGAFMRVVEAVRTADDPRGIPAAHWHSEPGESAPRRVVDGIDALVDASADELRLFSELGAAWAPSTRAEAR